MYAWMDARLGIERDLGLAGKAFPAEDSFLLGEVALFCFLVLALTGMFLGFFYEPSAADVQYQGSVAEYQDEEMPQAYVSVLNITYDVPYGMFIRRLHHWAAHLFVASLGLHMLRVFFTGSYQNPREPNWVVGASLAVLSMFAAYTGYALPFDEFAATATGIGYNIANSIPGVGDLLSYIVFGGEFPSQATIPRLYFLHVFLLPLAIAGLIALHLAILVRQKHTEAPRERDLETVAVGEESLRTREGEQVREDGQTRLDERTRGQSRQSEPTPDVDRERHSLRQRIGREDDSVIVGLPAYPNQAAISAVLFFLTLGVLSLLAGFLPVHNVAEYGPSDPAATPELIMPDWFLMWIFGFLKVIPAWASFTIPGTGVEVSTEFIGGVVLPGLIFGVIFAWPFIDSRETPRQFTADPLARPANTAVGIAGVVFVMLGSIAGMNTIVTDITGFSTEMINPVLLWSMLLGPVVAGGITYAVLRRYDAAEGRTKEGRTDEPANRSRLREGGDEDGRRATGGDERKDGRDEGPGEGDV